MRRRPKDSDLSPTVLAQASEIFKHSSDVAVITENTNERPIFTLWGRKDKQSIVIQREEGEYFSDEPPVPTHYARLVFSEAGDLQDCFASCGITPHRGLRKVLARFDRKRQKQARENTQKTVRMLVEKVYMELD